jgi:hypothetical protein
MQAADQVRVSWIIKPYGLTAKNSLAEGVMEEGVLHIELLNWLVAGDNNSEHRVNGGQFHNRAESLIVVDPGALSETPEDPASLVAIKGPVGTKLMREDPLAHQGLVLVLHSRAPIGVDKRSTYRGRDRGRCQWRRRGSKYQAIRKHPETRLGPSDISVRIHRRSHRYSRRRSSVRRRRSKAHGRRWRGLPRSLGVDDRRGWSLMRWWTIRGRRRCSSRTWRSRCWCGHAWCGWGRRSHVRCSRRR